MATSGYLVEVEKVTMTQMENWRNKYPEAFAREYDPASGLRFNAWIEGEK
jgi:trimethylamine-N-oxide reductase (cytochrome c)